MVRFMIYELEEVFPGPGLNLMLGPNGSGKSSIMSAIAVALAGDMKSVGRYTHLGEQVKRGCEEGAVEVELFGAGPAGKNLIVYRSFAAGNVDKSKFLLNGEPAGLRDVQKRMKELHIQVNNLCVFLAQFRVGEFAEMNPEQMLYETEKAADHRLYEKHVAIKEQSGELRKKATAIQQSQQIVDALRDKVTSMEAERKAEEERQEAAQRITHLRNRKAWAVHDAALEKVQKAREKKLECQKRVEEERQKEAPIRNALKDAKAAEDRARRRHVALSQARAEAVRSRTQHEVAVGKCSEKLEDIENSLAELEEARKRHLRDLGKERDTLARQQETLAGMRPTATVEAELHQHEKQRGLLRGEEARHKRAVGELNEAMAEPHFKKRQAEASLTAIRDRPVVGPMLRLKRIDRARAGARGTIDTDEARITKLRAEGLLKGKVIGPLGGVLTVKDAKLAAYVEDLIPAKWATAWVVELKEDHQLLHKAGIQGSLIQAQIRGGPVQRQFNLEPLRGYGLRWLDEGVECDPLVLSALHDVLAFGMHVYTTRPLTPAECQSLISTRKGDHKLQSLFSEQVVHGGRTVTKHFSTNSSNWSDDVAVSASDVRPARYLGGSTVDEQRESDIRAAEAAIAAADEEIRVLGERVHALTADFERRRPELMEQLKQTQTAIERINKELQHRKSVATAIVNSLAKIKLLEQQANDESKKIELHAEQKAQEQRREKLLETLMTHVQSTSDTSAWVAASLEAATALALYQHMQATVDGMGNRHADLQARLEHARREVIEAEKEAETQRRLAAVGCSREFFRELVWMEELERAHGGPLTAEVIDAKMHELQNQLNRGIGDASIVQRYEVEKGKLDEAEGRLELAKGEVATIQSEVNQVRDQWMSGVTDMVATIHKHFSKYFARIGCMGAVELQEHADGSYGILIKVSFRAGVAMQPLTGAAQSGGEKSVSTMLYLLCLQEVTHCPFRMVDEINQGMDASNERRIIDQIMQSCEDPRKDEHGNTVEPPQYFVVTPKLLPNLHFSGRVSIFNVFNGPSMLPQEEWDLARFQKIALSGKLTEAYARRKRRRHAEEQQSREAEALQGSQTSSQMDA